MQFAVFNVDCSRVLFNMKKLGHFRTSKNSPNKTTQSITFKFCKGCLNTFKNKRLVFGFRENECLIFKVSFSSLFLNLLFCVVFKFVLFHICSSGCACLFDRLSTMLEQASFSDRGLYCSRFTVSGERSHTIIRIEPLRDIMKGQEVTVSYSLDYFGKNNSDCRCPTCKTKETKVKTAPSAIREVVTPSAADEPRAAKTKATPSSTTSSAAEAPSWNAELGVGADERMEASTTLSVAEEQEAAEAPSRNAELGVRADERTEKKRCKLVKADDRLECFVCHSLVNRMDRHFLQHSDIFNERQRRFSLDFYRTRNAPKRTIIYDCRKCFRRFASLVTHKHINKCECQDIVKVENPSSRGSLPDEIRKAVKSSVLPSARELDIAQEFVDYKTHLAKCSGDDKRWSQDRGGIVRLMAQFFNLTYGLKKPELLVKGCLDMKNSRNLKPQTMLNYLSIFALFVDYCYLASHAPKGKLFIFISQKLS